MHQHARPGETDKRVWQWVLLPSVDGFHNNDGNDYLKSMKTHHLRCLLLIQSEGSKMSYSQMLQRCCCTPGFLCITTVGFNRRVINSNLQVHQQLTRQSTFINNSLINQSWFNLGAAEKDGLIGKGGDKNITEERGGCSVEQVTVIIISSPNVSRQTTPARDSAAYCMWRSWRASRLAAAVPLMCSTQLNTQF